MVSLRSSKSSFLRARIINNTKEIDQKGKRREEKKETSGDGSGTLAEGSEFDSEGTEHRYSFPSFVSIVTMSP